VALAADPLEALAVVAVSAGALAAAVSVEVVLAEAGNLIGLEV
jgi:hypothetical protein